MSRNGEKTKNKQTEKPATEQNKKEINGVNVYEDG